MIKKCPICGKEFNDPHHPKKIFCCEKCMRLGRRKDLTGKQFGYLTVLKRVGYSETSHSALWECKCKCGNIKIVLGNDLTYGHTKSCGCQKGKIIHGKGNTRLYRIYNNIKQRCYNSKNVWYKNYGNRGIKICNEWLSDFMNFYNWAINNGYKDDLTIDRIDVNGNYEPTNCRWATRQQQQNNRRLNHYFTYNNETHTGSEWARIIGVEPKFLYGRLRSHTFEDFIKQYI